MRSTAKIAIRPIEPVAVMTSTWRMGAPSVKTARGFTCVRTAVVMKNQSLETRAKT